VPKSAEGSRAKPKHAGCYRAVNSSWTLGPERPVFGVIGTTLRQGRLPWPSGGHAQCARQLAASTHRQPYPTHWVTGAAATRRHSSDRTPRPGVCQQPGSTTRQLPSCRTATSQPTQLRNFSQQPFLPARTTTSFYRRIQHHITGRNKRSFSGPHKLYGVDCLIEGHPTMIIFRF
jgi:hypothetical protein